MFLRRLNDLSESIYLIRESVGRIESRQLIHSKIENSGFRVFSQWDEDGIIQFLINKVKIRKKIFIEFGIENYTQSNTRFLLTNNNWSGLVIDGDIKNINYVKRDPIYWATKLKAHHSFIDRDNINKIISDQGISGQIGILSIDIDGVDYWVWEAINIVSPDIVICEYNNIFGEKMNVSVPYDKNFIRDNAHYSKIYYGASLTSLYNLAIKKGYKLVSSNSAGNNIFFVKDELMGDLKPLKPEDVFKESTFREYHDKRNNLTFDNFETRLKNISHLDVYNFDSKKIEKISDIIKIK
jgi:hypothetical protein